METKQLNLSMKEDISRLYENFADLSSAIHFTSLYIWRKEMELSVLIKPEFFAVKAGWQGEECWFFPCGEPEAVRRFLIELSSRPKARICYATEKNVEFVQQQLPGSFQFIRSDCDDEYLYDHAQQSAFAGKHFRHQRNAINRISKLGRVETRLLSEKNVVDAMEILDQWEEQSHQVGTNGIIGKTAAKDLLRKAKELDVHGVVIHWNRKPVALAAGYALCDEMFDLSICVQCAGNTDFSVFARHQLYEILPQSFQLINAEEDLGIDSLRQLKQGMNPCAMIKMYEGKAYDTTHDN